MERTVKEEKLKFSVEFNDGTHKGNAGNNTSAADDASRDIQLTELAGPHEDDEGEFDNLEWTEDKENDTEKYRGEYGKKVQSDTRDADVKADINTHVLNRNIRTEPAKTRDVGQRGKVRLWTNRGDDGTDRKAFSDQGDMDTKRRREKLYGGRVGQMAGQRKGKEQVAIDRYWSPGPAHYSLPTTLGKTNADYTKRGSPAFSFGSRSWCYATDSPGPAYAVDPQMGSKGKENRPSFSFGGRPKTPVRRDVCPGPGSYNVDVKPLWAKNSPRYSISTRTKLRSVDPVPPPNTYQLPSTLGPNVPHRKGGAAPTFHSKTEHMNFAADLAKTPGPAGYGAFRPSLTKRRCPEYTIKGRTIKNNFENDSPGPAAYRPRELNTHMTQSPRHLIGVRHSEFVMPTFTPADVWD